MSKEKDKSTEIVAIDTKKITDRVMLKVNAFLEAKVMHMPRDYSAENALKAANLILMDTVDREKRPVLEVCTQQSIAASLLEMIVEGLNPLKKQCYFIAYKNKDTGDIDLQYQRSYQGDKLLAKRDSGATKVRPVVIYKGDTFKFERNLDTGIIKIIEHKSEIDNIDPDPTKIRGAYCYVTEEDGTVVIELMSRIQLMNAWDQRKGQGLTTAHEKFGGEMAKRSIIRRTCKSYINSSDDNALVGVNDKRDHNATDQEALAEGEEVKTLSIGSPKKETEVDKTIIENHGAQTGTDPKTGQDSKVDIENDSDNSSAEVNYALKKEKEPEFFQDNETKSPQ